MSTLDYTKWKLPKGSKSRLGKGWIKEITYSPDGTHLAVASSIGIWIYDAHTRQELALFYGQTNTYSSLVYSPDGSTIAVGSTQGVHLYDSATGEFKPTQMNDIGEVVSLRCSPDGNTIGIIINKTSELVLGEQRFVYLLDAVTGKQTTKLASCANKIISFSSLAFSPGNETLATGSYRDVHLWDAATGHHKTTFTGHTVRVESIAYSPDGKTIVTSGGVLGKEVHLWDAATGQHKTKITEDGSSIAYSPDGKIIAIVSGSTTSLWDAETNTHKTTLNEHTGSVVSLAFSPDGKTITTATHEEVHLWNAVTGEQKATITGHANSIKNILFSPDGTTIKTSCSYERDLEQMEHLWDVITSRHITADTIVVYSPNGAMIATWSWEKGQKQKVHLKDTITKQHRKTFTEQADRISSVVYCHNSNTIAIWSEELERHSFLGSIPKVRKVSLWNSITSEQKAALSKHSNCVRYFGYTSDRRTIATRSDEKIHLWDATSGKHKVTFTIHADDANNVLYSPDGKTIATWKSDDEEVRLWDTATGQQITTLTTHFRSFRDCIYSPDGKTILTLTNEDGEVHLWDAATGKHKTTFVGHTSAVEDVVYSPDGSTIVSWGYEEVCLWDINTGKHKSTLQIDIEDTIWSVTYSSDGSTIAIICSSGSYKITDWNVYLWDVTTGKHKVLTGDNVLYSPDGKTIATWGCGEVCIWDATTGKHKTILNLPVGSIDCVAYSPDGTVLATGSKDGTVLLWEIGSNLHQNCNINPREIHGNWKIGYGLDIHSLSSQLLPDGGYDTKRSELGELVYQVKYQSNRSSIQPIAKIATNFIEREFVFDGYLVLPHIEVILPIPPLPNNTFQPVPEIATKIGQILGVQVVHDYLIKEKTTIQHNFESEESRREQLKGAFAVQMKNRKYRCVLLIDDIYNSGVTLTEATDVLKKQGGISQIFVLALTYTRIKR